MPNSIKNSIVLGILFIVITGFGFYKVNILTADEMKRLTLIENRKTIQLDTLETKASLYDLYNDSLQNVQDEFYKNDKIIPSNDESISAFKYLNYLSSFSESNIGFDFSVGTEQEMDGYYQREYILEGDAPFSNFYNFIWKVENYKRLYKIQSINLTEIKKLLDNRKSPQSYIRYSMRIQGYSLKENLYKADDIKETKTLSPVGYNPFLPLVKESLPPNTENLLVVSEAKLQGMTGSKAFITDSKGKLRIMRVGDKVYLGYLTQINTNKNMVEFTLNKGGFIEKVRLELSQAK